MQQETSQYIYTLAY
jgi:hypothetical protein